MERPTGRWGIHWQAPTSMITFFVAGLAAAIGHHVFYSSLHDKVVVETNSRWDLEAVRDGQEWKIRFGTALAFLTQSLFAEAIDGAFQQTIWVAAREKAISIEGLDAMFSAGGTIWSFFKFEFIRKASLGALLGLLKWLIPLSALITPATLTVIQSQSSTASIMAVPSVNFSIVEPLYHWNMSTEQIDSAASDNGITPYLNRLLSSTATSLQILPMKAVIPNSTYDLTFRGPSFRCSKPSPLIEEVMYKMANASYFISYLDAGTDSRLQFETKMSWLAFAPSSLIIEFVELARQGLLPLSSKTTQLNFLNFARNCVVFDTYFSPAQLNPVLEELGTVGVPLCEGIMGFNPTAERNVTHDYVTKTQLQRDTVRPTYNYGRLWIRVDNSTAYDCVLTDTEYSARFHYSASESMQRVDPDYKFRWTEDDLHGSYFAVGNALANFLTGAIRTYTAGSGMVPHRTRVTESAVFGALNFNPLPGSAAPGLSGRVLTPDVRALARNKTVGELVEELSRNLTLSLFSAEKVLDWNSRTANVTISSQANVYSYGSRNLIITYAVTCSMALAAVIIGLFSLFRNGVSHEIGFLTFLLTTRNPRLDNFTLGQSMGAMPHSKSVTDMKLRFGLIKGNYGGDSSEYDLQGQEVTRVGFGFEDEVQPLVKGMGYC
ncbi:hypothetical protein QBC44DRAFT_397347 [Cladorrhinum sp. PSN332]|nr:hypothetical protein QBC44DRAFT_397347 [Cladorrhinum sp. PSN332]